VHAKINLDVQHEHAPCSPNQPAEQSHTCPEGSVTVESIKEHMECIGPFGKHMNKALECQPELTQFGGPPVCERQWLECHMSTRAKMISEWGQSCVFYSSRTACGIWQIHTKVE